MRAQPRPGKRARINLLCRMHACRWTLFVREKNSVVKAQRARDFLKVFFFLFSFFPLSRTEEEEEEKQIMNGKGEIVGKRILVVFSRRHPPH